MNETLDTGTEITRRYWLYVLRLEQGKYYIGTTTKKNPQDRIRMHGSFYGAKWTQKYKPEETIELRDLGILKRVDAEKEEKKITLEYIGKFGQDNVRGGDLNYSGKYFKRFGRFIIEDDWRTITLVTLLLVVILFLLLEKYSLI